MRLSKLVGRIGDLRALHGFDSLQLQIDEEYVWIKAAKGSLHVERAVRAFDLELTSLDVIEEAIRLCRDDMDEAERARSMVCTWPGPDGTTWVQGLVRAKDLNGMMRRTK